MNKWLGIGRITKDPEISSTPQGTEYVNFTIAVFRDKETSDFIRCKAFKNNATFLNTYVHKGQLIAVDGALRNTQYTDKNGENRVISEIIVDRIELCSSKNEENNETKNSHYNKPDYKQTPNYRTDNKKVEDSIVPPPPSKYDNIVDDEDIPF